MIFTNLQLYSLYTRVGKVHPYKVQTKLVMTIRQRVTGECIKKTTGTSGTHTSQTHHALASGWQQSRLPKEPVAQADKL